MVPPPRFPGFVVTKIFDLSGFLTENPSGCGYHEAGGQAEMKF